MLSNTPAFTAQSNSNLWRVWLMIACGCGGLITGCDSAPPKPPPQSASASHDEHGHGAEADHGHAAPASFAEAVKQLESFRNTIRDAFAKNDAEAAHGPLHDVGHVLESLPALAEKAGLDASQKDIVKAAAEQLFGQFGKVDEMMHGEKGAKYEDVSSGIDKALTTLAGLSAPK